MKIKSDKSQNPSIEGLNINQYKLREYFCAYDRKNDLERRLKYLSLGIKLYLACGLSHDLFIEFHKERRSRIKRNLYFLRILMLVIGLYFMYESKFWTENSYHYVMKLYFVAGLTAWFIPFVVQVYTKNIRNSFIHTTTALANDRCRNWLVVASLNDQSTFRKIKDRLLEKNFENYEVREELAENATINALTDTENTKFELSSERHEVAGHGEVADVTTKINSNELMDNNRDSETSVRIEVKGGPSDFDNLDNFVETDNPVLTIDIESPERDKADEDQVSLISNEQSIVVAAAIESQVSKEVGSLEPGIDEQIDNSSLVNEVVTEEKNVKENKFRSELTEISRQENQFNKLPMVEVINFFYIMCCPALQDKVPQMSEEDFISFLKMAFLGAPKIQNLRFKHHKNKKKYIRGVFYQFLVKSQTDAYENVLHVRDRYAALIYEHFEGFSKQNVLDNFSKDESSWLSLIRNNNKSRIPIIQELPN